MRISLPALVRPGETATVQASLAPGPAGPVTRMFVVHFGSDSAFVEPAARPVLRQAAKYAEEHSKENLVILGHTDKTGDAPYNQSLSERRARAVYAFLTSGREPAASLAEWKALRTLRPKGELPSVKDSWGLRQAQYMLQDLGFYPGPVDGKPGDLTDSAVSAFRCQMGLPPGKILDDASWDALVDAYLKRDALAVPADRFLVNCSQDDLLKWLGAGEQDPVKNVPKAWRPNRRVELLFVRVDSLPCKVPPPDTWTLAPEGAGGSAWCLGPGDAGKRSCFLFPALPEKDAKPGKDQWVRPPADGAGFTAAGSILQETRQKDGSTKLLPFAKKKFALFTPDGEILEGENSEGKAQPARTDKDGQFSFSGKRPGLYCLEVGDDVLARLAEEGDEKVRGNSVCKTLTKAGDRLDVVLIDAPVLREIRLPVVAHLMTRTDPPAATRRTEAEVRAAFEQINRIWRQARIRFDPVEVVRESYKRPSSLPSGPAVSTQEFGFLLGTASFLGVINIFFVHDVDVPGGSPEFGFCLSFEDGMTRPGCAVADGPDPKLWVRVIAHELGHFLNLEHPEEQPGAKGSFSDRLMFGGLGVDTLLSKPEVERARSSLGARLECQPLRLLVTGAAPLGGRFSDKFIAVRAAGQAVIVEVTGPPALLAQGPVTWSGGAEVPGKPLQRSVSRAAVTSESITATLAGFSREIRVLIVDFDLEVQGAKPVSPGSTTFVATREEGFGVSIRALISPPLTIVPDDVVRWQGGAPGGAGPFDRTVSRSQVTREVVRATVGGTTLERTIVIAEAALTDEALKTERGTVQIEGVRNENHKSRSGKLGLADLVPDQPSSLFRVRVVFPGLQGSTVQAALTSLSRTGTKIDSVPVTLSRKDGDRFASPPLLAIVSVLPEIEADGLVVVRAVAGGSLRLEVAELTVAEARTRGRIIRLAIQAFEGVDVTVQDIRRHINLAREVWAQAGFEVDEKSVRVSVPDPADFAHLETDSDVNRLTQKERRLLGLEEPRPARSSVITDINVYYVNLITGKPAGSTYRNGTGNPTIDLQHAAIAVEMLSGSSVVGVSAREQDMILAHELGHLLLVNWGAEEHHRRDGTPWPSNFLMHSGLTEETDLHRSQVEHILMVVRNNLTPFVIFDP